MKIYKVIYSSIYLEEGDKTTDVKVFLSKDVALNYIKKQIKEIKKEVDDLEDYCVEETENSYERYLDGRSAEDSVEIWLEEDEFYDEIELLEEKSKQQEEEKEYEV
ncbi:unknown [Clostridium sp. CAG:440]|nr:unknown [Clostridium sp. CAG:440]